MRVVIVLSVFLKYNCPAVAIPVDVLSVGVKPWQSLPTVSPFPPPPFKLVKVTASPATVAGASGTNLPNIKFNSFIESFVTLLALIVNAPDLKPPFGVPITWSP